MFKEVDTNLQKYCYELYLLVVLIIIDYMEYPVIVLYVILCLDEMRVQ